LTGLLADFFSMTADFSDFFLTLNRIPRTKIGKSIQNSPKSGKMDILVAKMEPPGAQKNGHFGSILVTQNPEVNTQCLYKLTQN